MSEQAHQSVIDYHSHFILETAIEGSITSLKTAAAYMERCGIIDVADSLLIQVEHCLKARDTLTAIGSVVPDRKPEIRGRVTTVSSADRIEAAAANIKKISSLSSPPTTSIDQKINGAVSS